MRFSRTWFSDVLYLKACAEYTYDPLMRVKAILAKDPGQNQVVTRQYQYSAAGNISSKNTEHGAYTYQYDALYRLTQADNPTLPDEAYTYDALGNRITAAGTPGQWSYNANNELLGYGSKAFTHDLNGNMTGRLMPACRQPTSMMWKTDW